MRSVPAEIREKLLKRFYGGENQPKVRVLAKQASVNTLITEVIHEGISPGFGDVAIRQLPGDSQPSLAYAVCLDNGVGNVYSRRMPAFAEQEWDYLWSLGQIKDAAIEFDGYWRINPQKRFYELVTEQTPYVFFVDSSNNLYVQKWSETTTRLLLAENASNISACRGWQSTLDIGVDQGLIVGYLRGGKVYYRAYCQQGTGEYAWETENELTELGAGNTTLCVFRTNDFRIGFLCENAGQMKYVLSRRTYAGQSMPPEHAEARAQDAAVWINDLQKHETVHVEAADVLMFHPFLACYGSSAPSLALTGNERIGLREFVLTFNRPVGGVEGVFQNYVTLFPVRPVASCAWENGNQLRMILSQDLAQSVDLTVTVSECHEAWQEIGGQKLPLEAMTITLEGAPVICVHRESAIVEATAGMSMVDKIDYRTYFRESASVNAIATVTLSPVGTLPI